MHVGVVVMSRVRMRDRLVRALVAGALLASGCNASTDEHAGTPSGASAAPPAGSAGPPANAAPPAPGAAGQAAPAMPGAPEQNAAGNTGGVADASIPAPEDMPARHEPTPSQDDASVPADPGTPTIFWLDITGNRVLRAAADGSDMHVLAMGNGIAAPDGVAVDVESGFVYWTNMGSGLGGANLGSLQRTPLDGGTIETVVPQGVTNTPKQMTIDHVNRKLYWCDREGAKVWRADMDGGNPEILASGHGFNQLVGVTLDVPGGKVYFTDRNNRKILRMGLEMPAGETHATRTDLEELFAFPTGSMPIDLELDLDQRMIYWTDRGLGTLQRAGMDLPAGQSAANRDDVEVLASGLGDTIGVSIDHQDGEVYFTALTGQVWRARLDGSDREEVARSNAATGVSFVRVP
jgi:sugar lactone lactonase YvrE